VDAIEVGVLGATGMVGQRFVSLLAQHPWFRCTWLAATGAQQTYKTVAFDVAIPGDRRHV
jgi:aspartate-semialdehyde dehydrogenase